MTFMDTLIFQACALYQLWPLTDMTVIILLLHYAWRLICHMCRDKAGRKAGVELSWLGLNSSSVCSCYCHIHRNLAKGGVPGEITLQKSLFTFLTGTNEWSSFLCAETHGYYQGGRKHAWDKTRTWSKLKNCLLPPFLVHEHLWGTSSTQWLKRGFIKTQK